jgi:hypothetical protein
MKPCKRRQVEGGGKGNIVIIGCGGRESPGSRDSDISKNGYPLVKDKFKKWLKTFVNNAFRKSMTCQCSLNISLLAKNGQIVLFTSILP